SPPFDSGIGFNANDSLVKRAHNAAVGDFKWLDWDVDVKDTDTRYLHRDFLLVTTHRCAKDGHVWCDTQSSLLPGLNVAILHHGCVLVVAKVGKVGRDIRCRMSPPRRRYSEVRLRSRRQIR